MKGQSRTIIGYDKNTNVGNGKTTKLQIKPTTNENELTERPLCTPE